MKSLQIIFEDQHLIVVDKPAGQLVIPGRGEGEGTLLVDEVASHIRKKAYVVHRIDRETSGLVVFAKDAPTHRTLNLLWEGREVGKTYLGWVQGVPTPADGLIDAPLKIFGSGRMGVDPKGKASQTRYALISTVELPVTTNGGNEGRAVALSGPKAPVSKDQPHMKASESASLLELGLLTGRRHQIRVHLFYRGHPLLGDPLYGSPLPVGGYPRLMLHAHRLTLPWEGKTLTLQSEPPPDFKA